MPDVAETTETMEAEENPQMNEQQETADTPVEPGVEAATEVTEESASIAEPEPGVEASVQVTEESAGLAEPEPDVDASTEASEESAGIAEPGPSSAPDESPQEVQDVEESPAPEVEPAADGAAAIEALKPASPYDLPGDWYVIHSYSGYENKVKANLETRIQSMHMEDKIFEVHIPMEDVVEFKAGKKVTVPKKVFPGYILVRMSLDDDSWYAVRNTPGVTGFVAGNAQKPTPLSRREVERFLGVQEEEEKGKPRFKPEWDVGEQVRVVTGPFADFNGTIEELNVDQQKVVVLVNIFGRDTPVELGFEDIQKN